MRKKQKQATRNKIKKEALHCFFKRGFEKTNISHITQSAEVAQGTFYVHFSNKEEILEELLQEFNQGLVERFISRKLPPPPLTIEIQVNQLAKIFLSHWKENHELVKIYAEKISMGTSMESLRDGVNLPTFQFLVAALQRISKLLKTKLPQVELVVHGLLSMWLRIGMQYLFNQNITHSQAQKILVKMTIGALKGVIPNIDQWSGELN